MMKRRFATLDGRWSNHPYPQPVVGNHFTRIPLGHKSQHRPMEIFSVGPPVAEDGILSEICSTGVKINSGRPPEYYSILYLLHKMAIFPISIYQLSRS